MTPRPARVRPAVVDQHGRRLADDLRLSVDAASGRTHLAATTGSALAQFLESLAEVWNGAQIVSLYDTVAAALFEREYCAEIERRVRVGLWEVIARDDLMPLAVPSIRWVWLPSPSGTYQLSPAAAATVVELPADADVTPGATLPENSGAVCVGEVVVAALPAARHRRGPRHPGIRHPDGPLAAPPP